ncbi:hypothetical protein [Burkholderia sp. Bp9012]|uniref:hypothetical protein n=1 Tax=Burkholderia sp. Bp9012 TaxID=2184562 RepID=UPI001623D868|nr:hypothetical protein [Burkholderia sp. Bp9012]
MRIQQAGTYTTEHNGRDSGDMRDSLFSRGRLIPGAIRRRCRTPISTPIMYQASSAFDMRSRP